MHTAGSTRYSSNVTAVPVRVLVRLPFRTARQLPGYVETCAHVCAQCRRSCTQYSTALLFIIDLASIRKTAVRYWYMLKCNVRLIPVHRMS